MLPSNIDLTENNDFSSGWSGQMDTFIDMEYYDDQTVMSNDEYKFLVWWESIFGKKRHPNLKRILFPKPGYDTPYEPRIPWENNFSLFNRYPINDRIPWATHQSIFNDVAYNLFNRR